MADSSAIRLQFLEAGQLKARCMEAALEQLWRARTRPLRVAIKYRTTNLQDEDLLGSELQWACRQLAEVQTLGRRVDGILEEAMLTLKQLYFREGAKTAVSHALLDTLCTMQSHRKQGSRVLALEAIALRRRERHAGRTGRLMGLYWERWRGLIQPTQKNSQQELEESVVQSTRVRFEAGLSGLWSVLKHICKRQTRQAFQEVHRYGNPSHTQSVLARQSTLRSVLQRQATRRFLKKAELLKFNPLLRGFYYFYKRVESARFQQVKLFMALSLKYARIWSVRVANAFTQIKLYDKQAKPSYQGRRAAKEIKGHVKLLLVDFTKLLERKFSTHHQLIEPFRLIRNGAVRISSIRSVNSTQLIRLELQYARIKLTALARAVNRCRNRLLSKSFRIMAASKKVAIPRRKDSSLYVNCFRHYCYLATYTEQQSNMGSTTLGRSRKKVLLGAILQRDQVRQRQQKYRALRQLRQLLLPKYNYRERSQLLKRMEQMKQEKERLIREQEARSFL